MSLAHFRILVTKPGPRGKRLCQMIAKLGGLAHQLPSIEFVTAPYEARLRQAVTQLASYDLAIFVSPAAIRFTLPVVKKLHKAIPSHIQIAVMGPGSAETLKDYGMVADLMPHQHFQSEGLLELPEFHSLNGQRVILFRGVGGRQWLANNCRERGAILNEVVVYERQCPTLSKPQIQTICSTHYHVIVTTSPEGLLNLLKMLGNEGKLCLKNSAILVINKKMAKIAQQHHLDNPLIIAANASETAIIGALEQWM